MSYRDEDIRPHRIPSWTRLKVQKERKFSVNLDLSSSSLIKTANWWIHVLRQAGLSCDISVSATLFNVSSHSEKFHWCCKTLPESPDDEGEKKKTWRDSALLSNAANIVPAPLVVQTFSLMTESRQINYLTQSSYNGLVGWGGGCLGGDFFKELKKEIKHTHTSKRGTTCRNPLIIQVTCLNSDCLRPNYWICGTSEWPQNGVPSPTPHTQTILPHQQSYPSTYVKISAPWPPCCLSLIWFARFTDLIDWRANSNEVDEQRESQQDHLTNPSLLYPRATYTSLSNKDK